MNRQLAGRLLEKRGYTVVSVGNGKEALAELESPSGDEFDVVLMDVQMPVMDGFQATAEIRKRESISTKYVPIIAMTAHAMKSDRARCLAAGMDGYVSKPIHSDELYAAIESVTQTPAEAPKDPPPAAAAKALDTTALLARLEGDVLLARDLTELFLAECPKMMKEVSDALEQRDAKALEKAAHSLKGSIGNFSKNGAFEAAQKLELAARSGALAGADLLFQALSSHVEELKSALGKLREGVPS